MSIVNNRKAYFEYHVLEEFEAGIVLLGSEVKSIRMGNVTLADSFIYLKSGEVWIKNFKVARYKQTHLSEKHEDNREKKLLLTKTQIIKISRMMEDKGITCVPLQVFSKNNKLKVKIGVVKGKKLYDKKESIKKKDIQREIKRQLNINI
jgi:SsrA-binding protein